MRNYAFFISSLNNFTVIVFAPAAKADPVSAASTDWLDPIITEIKINLTKTKKA